MYNYISLCLQTVISAALLTVMSINILEIATPFLDQFLSTRRRVENNLGLFQLPSDEY
jgi:hypothetical protein